jgi:hypothetical protein
MSGSGTRQRPRGFIDNWSPRAATIHVLDTIAGILEAYRAQLPLSLRQLFYILVGRHGYEKTELAYDRLGETMNKARRARVIDMDCIRDDGFIERGGHGYQDAEDAYNSIIKRMEDSARYFTLDRRQGQSRHLAIWCEASGMVPQLFRIADPFDITVYSSGGFDSLTDKHRIPRAWARDGMPVEVLHIGDFDPSGVHVCSSLGEDLAAFCRHYGGEVAITRVAVTPEQAAKFNLQSAPPKATDRRSFEGNETYQAEALDPRDLANIVRQAIESRLDMAAYHRVLAEEQEARQDVLSRMGLDDGAP